VVCAVRDGPASDGSGVPSLSLNVLSVRPITGDAYVMHLLNALYHSQLIARGPLPPPNAAGAAGGHAMGSGAFGGGAGGYGAGRGGAPAPGAWGGASSSAAGGGMALHAGSAAPTGTGALADPVVAAVLSAFQTTGAGQDEGVSVNSVINYLRSGGVRHIPQAAGASEEAIRHAVGVLSMEGMLYSTVDDNHFRTTE
jgi:hypothetical protein